MSSDAARRVRPALRQGGYNLVALVVILVVVNIAVAAAMPMWSNVVQRDREAELLFRGWQYAEAIRVFQVRFGRLPVRLEELIEVEPRCIRQLWTDPLSDSGAWELILAPGQELTGAGGGRPPGGGSLGRDLTGGRPPGRPATQTQESETPSQVTAFDQPERESLTGVAGEVSGPIEGVRPTATGKSLKSYQGRTEYRKWEFRATMLGGQSLSARGVPRSPRMDFESLTRPLPSSLGSTSGENPEARATPDAGDDDDD